MPASLIQIMLSAISSSLALPAQSPAAQGLGRNLDPQCFALDHGTDPTWRNDCTELLQRFMDRRGPADLVFGAGGIPVPYIYRGPVQPVPYRCEIRIELLNNAPSETVSHLDLAIDGSIILNECVKYSPTALEHRLGGSMRGSGAGGNIYAAVGKIPVPGPGVGTATAVEQPYVDVT